MKQLIILSLGGSVIFPEEIDIDFLKNFRETILHLLDKYRFIIVCGGGKVCRNYINAARSVKLFENEVYDNLGISITKSNGELIKAIFNDVAYPNLHCNYKEIVDFDELLVGAGFLPGTSTDFDAVMFAQYYNSKTIVNISNIEYLYTKDPKKNKDAKKIENISWKEFRKIIGNKWKAGMNFPFDPIASKKAEELKLKVIIMNNDLNNFKNYLEGRSFKGTVIE